MRHGLAASQEQQEKLGLSGRLKKAKTPAEMLALRSRGVLLPTTDGTQQELCQWPSRNDKHLPGDVF